MRTQKETYLDKCMELLGQLKLTQEQLDDLEAYLSGKKDTEVLDQLPYQNLGVSPKSYLPALTCLVSYGYDNPKQSGRLFHILFAIGGTSCHCLVPNLNSPEILNRLLTLPDIDPAKVVAVAAEQLSSQAHFFRGNTLHWFIRILKNDSELIKNAYLVSNYPLTEKNISYSLIHSFGAGQVYLLTAYFLTKYPDGKGPLAKEDLPLMKYYEDTLTDNLGNIYDTNTIAISALQELSQAIRRNQVTDRILKLAGKNYRMIPYFLNLFGGAAFLNFGLSDILKNFAKVCFAASLHTMFTNAVALSDSFWMDAKIMGGDYDTFFDIDSRDLILQAASRELDAALKTQYHKNKDLFLQVLDDANAHDSFAMMDVLKQEDKLLFLKIQKHGGSKERDKLINLIADKTPAINTVKTYLRGEADISSLYPYQNQIYNQYGYSPSIMQARPLLHSYVGTYHDEAFYNRVVSYQLLRGSISFFYNEIQNSHISVKQLFAAFESEHLDMAHQLTFIVKMYEYHFYGPNKNSLETDTIEVFAAYLEKYREELLSVFRKSDSAIRVFAIKVLRRNPDENKEALLAYTQDSSKAVREELLNVLYEQTGWEEEILALLSSKKAADRDLAVRTLATKRNFEKYREKLTGALEKEKNAKIRTLLSELLNEDSTSAGNVLTLQDLVKELHKGGKKRSLAWAYETPFSEVHKKTADGAVSDSNVSGGNVSDGNISGSNVPDSYNSNVSDNDAGSKQIISEPLLADEKYLQAILLCYSSMPTCGVNKDAAALAAELNEAELAVYVNELFDKWLALGAEAKKRWVLYAASIHGGTDIIKKLQHQINDWPQHSRGAIAADAVQALALNPKPEALLIVDGISRKFKFRQVKAAAAEALKFAAEQLGITTEELADRIVPDLGFDEKMERHFDYGERTFTVTITPALEIEVFDENGKKLKNLPAPGKKDDPEKSAESYAAFKEMKKQMKTTVSSQKMRLEMALSTERKWTCDAWKKLFVENSIMHQFAIGLIWGIYEDNKLTKTFRYMEDGSFNTEEEEEFILPESNCGSTEKTADSGQNVAQNAENNTGQQNASPQNNSVSGKQGKIGLVHPVELSGDSITAWKTQLEDYEITQPIEQLSRPVYHRTEDEADSKSMERFGGYILNDLSLIGKMQNMGWYRGQAEDAGIFYYFYREDKEQGLMAELNFSGTYVAGENEDVTVLDVKFNKKISELSDRYFSEIVMQTAKAVSSSQERNEHWKK